MCRQPHQSLANSASTHPCAVIGSRTGQARVPWQVLQYMDKKPQAAIHRPTRVGQRVCFEMSTVHIKVQRQRLDSKDQTSPGRQAEEYQKGPGILGASPWKAFLPNHMSL